MKYIGIRSTSAIPKNAVSQSLASEERVHGRVLIDRLKKLGWSVGSNQSTQ